jgi:hypothetical protein
MTASSSRVEGSFSSVFAMEIESPKSLRIFSFEVVSSSNPVEGSSAGRARSSVVIASYRFRSNQA